MERSEIERRAALVKETLDRLGIEAVVVDLDDFLSLTREVFQKRFGEFAEMVSKVLGIDKERVRESLELYNSSTFKQFAVNPKRWKEVVRLMAEDLGIGYDYLGELGGPIFESIYTTPLLFREGAEELLAVLSASGIKLAILTHANEEWTWRKYEWLKLDRFLPRERMFIANEDEFKGPVHWQRASEALAVQMGDVIVGGDSLPGDVRAGLAAGARKAFWLALNNGWVMYNHGEVPEGVCQIKRTDEMIERILMM